MFLLQFTGLFKLAFKLLFPVGQALQLVVLLRAVFFLLCFFDILIQFLKVLFHGGFHFGRDEADEEQFHMPVRVQIVIHRLEIGDVACQETVALPRLLHQVDEDRQIRTCPYIHFRPFPECIAHFRAVVPLEALQERRVILVDIRHHRLARLDGLLAHAVLEPAVLEAEHFQIFKCVFILRNRDIRVDLDRIGLLFLRDDGRLFQHRLDECMVMIIAYETARYIAQRRIQFRHFLE